MQKILDTAIEAAQAAEEIILHYFDKKNLSIEIKPDHSPVTKADKEAEEIIKKIVSQKFPDHAFLGEESGKSREDAKYLWVIDPVDGTKNFIKNLPLFATEIAVFHRDEVVVGISNAPKLNEFLYASKNNGTFLNKKPTYVSKIDKLNQAYITHGGVKYFRQNNQLKNLGKLSSKTYSCKGFGDFWGHHLVTAGRVEANLEAHGELWDIAALSLIVKEAGGKATDFFGKPIDRSSTSMISANGLLHEEILGFFREKF